MDDSPWGLRGWRGDDVFGSVVDVFASPETVDAEEARRAAQRDRLGFTAREVGPVDG